MLKLGWKIAEEILSLHVAPADSVPAHSSEDPVCVSEQSWRGTSHLVGSDLFLFSMASLWLVLLTCGRT